MGDQIKITINYFRLKKYLIEQLNYSERAAIITIEDIRKMNPDIRKAFLVWFTTGEAPKGELHGINYNNLINYRKISPVAAFLAIDWYVKEPEEAYSAIALPLKDDEKKIVGNGKEQRTSEQLTEKDTVMSENTADITE